MQRTPPPHGKATNNTSHSTQTHHQTHLKTPRSTESNKNTTRGQRPPEESLAALTRHGVEVEAGGLVAAHATDPRGVAVELLRSDYRRRHRHGLHH